MLIIPDSKIQTDINGLTTKETAMFSFLLSQSKEISNIFSDITIEISRTCKTSFVINYFYNGNIIGYLGGRIENNKFILSDLTTINFKFVGGRSEYFEREYKRKLSGSMIGGIELNGLGTTIFANLVKYLIDINKQENLGIKAIQLCPLYTAKGFYDKLIKELYLLGIISRHEIKVLEIDDDEPRDYYYFYI